MFFKKAKNIDEKLLAVNERIAEIGKDLILRSRHVNEKKQEIASILGVLALSPDDTENQGLLTRGKKALGIQEENYSDLKTQHDFLKIEREKLGIELQEAKVRDLPLVMEERLGEFNLALEEALKVMGVLKILYDKMRASRDNFDALDKEYFNTCGKLGIVKGLELKTGFGALAFESYPLDMTFALPDFHSLLGALQGYKNKLESVADFKRTQPDYQKRLEEVAAHDAKAAKLEFSQEGFKNVFSLPGS